MRDDDPSRFAEAWLPDAPLATLASDAQGRIRWCNQALERLAGLPAEQLLGLDRDGAPEGLAGALFADEGDVRIPAADGTRWLRVLHSAGPEGLTVRVLVDVTRERELAEENAALREQVEELRLTDDLTGLPNRRALRQQLELHVSRSRRYGNPLSVIDIRLQSSDGASPADPAVMAAARYLRDRLRWVDQIARWDHAEFLVVLPETAWDEAVQVTANLLGLPEDLGDPTLSLRHGLATWNRGDDVRALLQRARDAVDAEPQAPSA